MSQLEKLNWKNGRIVDFEVVNDGFAVEICDGCNLYFIQILNKEDFGELIEELQEMHKGMKG